MSFTPTPEQFWVNFYAGHTALYQRKFLGGFICCWIAYYICIVIILNQNSLKKLIKIFCFLSYQNMEPLQHQVKLLHCVNFLFFLLLFFSLNSSRKVALNTKVCARNTTILSSCCRKFLQIKHKIN